jgi:hypothetical protein
MALCQSDLILYNSFLLLDKLSIERNIFFEGVEAALYPLSDISEMLEEVSRKIEGLVIEQSFELIEIVHKGGVCFETVKHALFVLLESFRSDEKMFGFSFFLHSII